MTAFHWFETPDGPRVDAHGRALVDLCRDRLETLYDHASAGLAEHILDCASSDLSKLWLGFKGEHPHGIALLIRQAHEDLHYCPRKGEDVRRVLYDIRDKLYRFGSE